MRLLLDQNLSPRLLGSLGDLYPGSTHVRSVGLASADDDAVWAYAAREGLVIRRGNCSTGEVERLLREHHADLVAFERHEEGTFLALG